MEKEKYLFDPLLGDDVILNYSIDVFKLLIEDKEWSESIIMSLDVNDFSLYNFRMLIGSIQDYYLKKGVIPDYDILFNHIFSFNGLSDVDKELYTEYRKKCSEKILSEDRIEQIKLSLPYWSSYILMIKIGNCALDNTRDGYGKPMSFEQRRDKIISMAAKLKMLADNPNITPHTYEGWV